MNRLRRWSTSGREERRRSSVDTISPPYEGFDVYQTPDGKRWVAMGDDWVSEDQICPHQSLKYREWTPKVRPANPDRPISPGQMLSPERPISPGSQPSAVSPSQTGQAPGTLN